MLDYDAFDLEYEEESSYIDQYAIIQACTIALQEERSKPEPKYARLARDWSPKIRDLFYNGVDSDIKSEAKMLLEDLYMESTVPLNDLETAYELNEHGDYVEVDSYTHISYEEYENVRLEADELGDRTGAVIPAFHDDITSRLLEEYKDFDDTQLAAIVAVNRGTYLLDEELIYDDRDYLPAPLQGMSEDTSLGDINFAYEMFSPVLASIGKAKARFLSSSTTHNWADWWRESELRKEFLAVLKVGARECTPAMLALIFMGVQDEAIGVPAEDAKLILLDTDSRMTLFEYVQIFGDEILEDGIGNPLAHNETTEQEIEFYAQRFLSEMQTTCLPDTDEIKEVPLTAAYLVGVINAVGSLSDLREGGFAEFRRRKSPMCAQAYDRTMVVELNNKTPRHEATKKAWRAFFQASTVATVKKDGLVVRNILTGEERQISWNLAKWKLSRGEIFLNHDDRLRLKNILFSNNRGRALREAL